MAHAVAHPSTPRRCVTLRRRDDPLHDPVRWYLDRAAAHDLLSAEQEADLAKRYQAGLAAEQRLAEASGLTPRRRARLRSVVADGRRAKQTLVLANLRLVVPTAKRYAGRGMDLLEAIQEANTGLVRAVEKFDHTKGYKFSTYAVWWIRQAAQRGLAYNARTIRVPQSVWEDQAKIRRAEDDLREQLGRDATPEEVAEATGLSVGRVKDVDEALEPTTSLDRPVGEDGDSSLGDLLPDEVAEEPAELATAQDARWRIADLLGALDERERTIVELRFGFRDGRVWTYPEIGDEVGLTSERARQLAATATDKLREPARAGGFDAALAALAA